MQITNFGHFKISNPDAVGVIFYANEDGQDWYEMRRSLTTWEIQTGAFVSAVYGAWATVDPITMIITNTDKDPSRLVPDDRLLLGIDADYWLVTPGMTYEDGQLLPPIPKEETAA